jgi:hypothetical protein
MQFQLLGFHNVSGQYPAQLIPIGRLEGQLVAIYPGGKTHLIAEDSDYEPLSAQQVSLLQGFDFANTKHRLFAKDKKTVLSYNVNSRVTFFGKLLKDPDFCLGNPGMRTRLKKIVAVN